MHIGIQLATSNVTWHAIREAALRVEELGFDSLWVPDHLMAWDRRAPRFEAWQLLAALAPLTKRVRLGPLVSPVTFRHPGILAKMVATLDHVSGGRVILGLGAGGMAEEHRRYGLPFGRAPERAARFKESVHAIRSLLEDPQTSVRGRYYTLRSAIAEPKPLQRRVPLLIAGTGRATIRLAAAVATLWNAICLPTALARHVAALRSELAATGREAGAVVATASFRLVIRDDRAAIDARVGQLPSEWRADRYRISGNSDDVMSTLARYRDAGAGGLIVQVPAPFDVLTLERLALMRGSLARSLSGVKGGSP